jgi:hypothetical protein
MLDIFGDYVVHLFETTNHEEGEDIIIGIDVIYNTLIYRIL